jgi:O-methyltransferase
VSDQTRATGQGRDVSAFVELPPDASLEQSYVHLLKLCLTGLSSPQPFMAEPVKTWREVRPTPLTNLERRVVGSDWPIDGWTMIGLQRLDNVQHCVESVLADGVRGDLIETGVWRGGTTILMRALLKVHGDTDRTVFVADSFQGLPPPEPDQWPADEGSPLHEMSFLRVPVEDVEAAFRRFGVLDQQVKFVEGWFEETLPKLNDRIWSVIRLDGDMYGSTITSLENLYPRLSPGGYVIIDDYGAVKQCKRAVDDFRERNGITEEVQRIDWSGIYWRRDA